MVKFRKIRLDIIKIESTLQESSGNEMNENPWDKKISWIGGKHTKIPPRFMKCCQCKHGPWTVLSLQQSMTTI